MEDIIKTNDTTLLTEEHFIGGFAKEIRIRIYVPALQESALPIVLYFHGGRFNSGSVDDSDAAARFVAQNCPALVISVDYSLAPAFPFPAALEDGYLVLQWAVAHAKRYDADATRLALAGHDAGGNLATCLAAVARDRFKTKIAAQALLAPLLDPSMTLMAGSNESISDERKKYSACYRTYLPSAMQRSHPYAAPVDSCRLTGLPPAFIAVPEFDAVHPEAELYRTGLIQAGIQTTLEVFKAVDHWTLESDQRVLKQTSLFLKKHLTQFI